MPSFALSRRQRGFESRWGHHVRGLVEGYLGNTLWDIKAPRNASLLGPPLRAHGDPVTSVAFSQKDARTIATASDDKTLRVWDLTVKERPVPLGPRLEGHQAAVNSVAIGAKGIMASASDDQTVRLWDLTTLDAIRKDPVGHACMAY